MAKDRSWNKANEFEPQPCPVENCSGTLAALYHVTLAAPFPWEQVGFTKSSIKTSRVQIVAAAWEQAQPFCSSCGWRSLDRRESTKSEAILRLMRALILRGASAAEIQQLVGDSTSTIDVLAATHPDPAGD